MALRFRQTSQPRRQRGPCRRYTARPGSLPDGGLRQRTHAATTDRVTPFPKQRALPADRRGEAVGVGPTRRPHSQGRQVTHTGTRDRVTPYPQPLHAPPRRTRPRVHSAPLDALGTPRRTRHLKPRHRPPAPILTLPTHSQSRTSRPNEGTLLPTPLAHPFTVTYLYARKSHVLRRPAAVPHRHAFLPAAPCLSPPPSLLPYPPPITSLAPRSESLPALNPPHLRRRRRRRPAPRPLQPPAHPRRTHRPRPHLVPPTSPHIPPTSPHIPPRPHIRAARRRSRCRCAARGPHVRGGGGPAVRPRLRLL